VPGQDPRSTSLRPAATPARRLVDLADRLGTGLVADAGPLDAAITGVTHDSAAALPGDLYAALPGTHTHGARFADRAVAAGAVAVLTDEAGRSIVDDAGRLGAPVVVVDDPRLELGAVASWIYGEPSKKLRVLGVTGTNGKTTTSYLLDAGLRAAGEKTGLVGTIETRIGEWVAPSARTTPEAPDLQAMLAVMVERGVGSVSMEVSSHALALHRVDGTAFDVVAFTNLSQDHLDFHADLDDYFNAKARLFTSQFARKGVVNTDDEHGRRLLGVADIPLTTVSATTRDAQWWISDQSSGSSSDDGLASGRRTDFVVHGPHLVTAISIRLPGSFNVANALLAFVTLVVAGVEPQAAADGIADVSVVPGRMEAVSVSQPFVALVDYAHTPDAVVTLLTTLRQTTAGRLIVVLGCGGDRDRAKRPLMGAAAARLADVAVLTSDNPRSEEPDQILDAMLDGAMEVAPAQRAEVIVELDRLTAIQIAVNQARAGDVVVVAGKGHEQGQEVGGVVHPFDDRTVLRAAIVALTTGAGAS
jgi:UDP-N-acetylmuramoyl-L-alanyl-D-glutamate--2,6-diaminopimelate ligase